MVTLQAGVELFLAIGAASLLLRDVLRGRRDRLLRPITLLAAGVMAALLIGISGGRAHPHPLWLMLPAGILSWELVRGWRRAPRCHLRESAVGAIAASLVLAALGLGLVKGTAATILLAGSIGLVIAAVILLWRSHLREPSPARPGDPSHYERRSMWRLSR